MLVDNGSLFKITGFDVNNDECAGPDSFNLMMELFRDENGMVPTGTAPSGRSSGFLNIINHETDKSVPVPIDIAAGSEQM